jgi:hypothetical protein
MARKMITGFALAINNPTYHQNREILGPVFSHPVIPTLSNPFR